MLGKETPNWRSGDPHQLEVRSRNAKYSAVLRTVMHYLSHPVAFPVKKCYVIKINSINNRKINDMDFETCFAVYI